MIKEDIIKLSTELNNELISIRRHLHRNPELSSVEYETSKYIYKKLKSFGIEDVRDDIYNTAIVAVIKGNDNGKTILLRADMDALPINEENEVEYCSKNTGIMHACGHDAHVTWLLGASYILNKMKSKFKGNIKILFQPAEEGIGGADYLLKNNDILIKDPKVDLAFAAHVWPSIDVGCIGIVDGVAMAAANKFIIKIIGRGGHGAEPYKTVDPISLTCQVYTALQTIISRRTSPFSNSVLSIGLINTKGAYNIIPDVVEMEGTIRANSYVEVQNIMKEVENIVNGIVISQGGKYKITEEKPIHSVVNNHNLVHYTKNTINELYSEDRVDILKHGSMTGEDFCYFSNRVPSVFMFIGTKNIDKNIISPLHTDTFNIDESILKGTAEILSYISIKYLNEN